MGDTATHRHGLIAKTFHWGFVLVFAYAVYKQVDNVGQLEDSALLRFEIIFATVFLVMLALRFVYMRRAGPTAVPATAPAALKIAARLGHIALYLSVGMIALSGLGIGALYSLGWINGFAMDAMIGLHEAAVMASYVTVAGHIAAAIFHRIKGDGIWSSMVPIFREAPKGP